MRPGSQTLKTIPWTIVGSNHFGRTPKISDEQTFNMIRVDDFLFDFAGYQQISVLSQTYTGRALYTSTRANLMFIVIGNVIYAADSNLFIRPIGFLDSFNGDVFITENDTSQIVFCDKKKLYVFNYDTDKFNIPTLPPSVLPGYVTFQDGYVIFVDLLSNRWYLSAPGDANNWFWGSSGQSVFEILSTKADLCMAVSRFPGKGNLLLVLGNNVGEYFTDVGSPPLSPYKRNSNINVNVGVINAATVATEDSIIAWLGYNQDSGPVITISEGGTLRFVGTDGINYRLSQLNHPEISSAFFLRIGDRKRLFYQITFYDPSDNVTYLYDVTNDEFYTLTDENWNYHIARKVQFFNNKYYFVSFNDGALYELSPQITVYNYGTFQNDSPRFYPIPRGRVCKNIREDSGDAFVINSGSFTLEQGEDPFYPELSHPNYNPHIDLSVSMDGGVNFSSFQALPVKFTGHRISRPLVWGLGYTNDFVSQFRFWSYARLAVTNGVLNVYK
jgi:hypothetical protein